MPIPSTIQASRKRPSPRATASSSNPKASAAELAASTGRPPWRSTSAPTEGDTNPETSVPTESPPTTHASGQPVSRAIGSARTAGR